MLPNRLIVGWCLGVVAVSTGDAAARSSRSMPDLLPPAATRGAQKAPDRDASPSSIPNPANVSLQMNPGQSVSVGTKIWFRVTTRKPGYLLLVDISGLRIDVRVDQGRLRAGDVPELVGDRSRLTADTGWEPRIPLERSLADLLSYWRERVAQAAPAPGR